MNTYNEIIENKKLIEAKLSASVKSLLFWGVVAGLSWYFDWGALLAIGIILVIVSTLSSITFALKVEIWEAALCNAIYLKSIDEERLKQDLFLHSLIEEQTSFLKRKYENDFSPN